MLIGRSVAVFKCKFIHKTGGGLDLAHGLQFINSYSR